MRAPLSGVVIPVCTPLSGDGTAVDVTSLRRHLDRLVTYGVDGVFVLGTSGEFGFLTDEQRRRVLEVTVDEIDGRVPVLVGISDTATARALAQAEMLVPLGRMAWSRPRRSSPRPGRWRSGSISAGSVARSARCRCSPTRTPGASTGRRFPQTSRSTWPVMARSRG